MTEKEGWLSLAFSGIIVTWLIFYQVEDEEDKETVMKINVA